MENARRLCRLHLTLGRGEQCPEGACPFWEEGGAVLPAGCGLERLGIEAEQPDLAEYLLDLRAQLECARDREERERARETFALLVPPGLR
jgi:hypothetical protein